MIKGYERPLRLGIIGAGHIVQQIHLPLLAQMPAITVEGLFDIDGDRLQELKNQYTSIKICGSLDELLDLRPEIVLVTCPNYLHAPMSIAALTANAHVLCEKPMATTTKEAQEMVDVAHHTGKKLMIAFANRFRPEVLALKQAIQAGVLGKITAIRCGWLRQKGVPGIGTWFTKQEHAGGGALTDLGSHLIDLAFYLGGYHPMQFASAVLNKKIGADDQAGWYTPHTTSSETACDVEISASGLVAFEDSFNLFVDVSWSCSIPQDYTYIHIFGEQGSAKLETLFGFSPNGTRPRYPLQIWTNGRPDPQAVAGSTDVLQAYREQWRFFVESIRSDQPSGDCLHGFLATVQTIEALYQSAAPLSSKDTI
jgi:predicted dehydrogenase